MRSPLVSVIIPNYNHAFFLRQRIETVLAQTYDNFEIILLDDCSTDDSRQVIEQYQHQEKVSQVLFNEVNSGTAFRQWEKGIGVSRGEYVWIAESDDWCEPTFLETIISGIIDNDCVLGYCQSYYVNDDNSIIWQTKHKNLADRVAGKAFIRDYMLGGTAIYNASMAVWRKDAFEHISKDFLEYKLCGDWLFWIELCSVGDVFISGKLLNYFRKHPGNVSDQGISSGNSFLEELKMFSSLYIKGQINEEAYFKSLKSEYVQFKAVEKKLDLIKREQIRNLFFQQAGLKSRLNNYYRGFYFRYAANKLFDKIFTGSK